ncbi:putative solute:sodium symporter small subunit [Janthinobacterium sp. K2Li3]|nr:putative solute:sodium symporter small subunit [Janthinobacterium sp. K2Li3]
MTTSTMDKPADHAALQARRAAHWRKTQRLTAILLLVWLLTGFLTVFYARELLHLNVFGWPLPFYMAAQGASLVYLAIIGVYAWSMRRLDREFHQAQHAAEKQP